MARRIFYCCCCCFTFWAASLCSFHASPAPPEQADSFCILILLLFRFVFVFRVIFLIIMIVMIITLQACLFFLFSFLCFIFDYFNFKAARTRLDTFFYRHLPCLLCLPPASGVRVRVCIVALFEEPVKVASGCQVKWIRVEAFFGHSLCEFLSVCACVCALF